MLLPMRCGIDVKIASRSCSVMPLVHEPAFFSARSGCLRSTNITRAPPISSMPRLSELSPDSASDDITTIENAPMVIDSTVKKERNLWARRTRCAMRRYSIHTTLHLEFVVAGRGRLDEDLLAFGHALRQLDVAIVARTDGHFRLVALLLAVGTGGHLGHERLAGLLHHRFDRQRRHVRLGLDVDADVGGHARLDQRVRAVQRG